MQAKSTEIEKNQISSHGKAGQIEQENEFSLDSQEYQQVFKVFDKDNTGEINIHQVYELINKFEQSAAEKFSNIDLTGAQAATNGNQKSFGNVGSKGGPRKSTGHALYQPHQEYRRKQGMNGDANGKISSPSRKYNQNHDGAAGTSGGLIQLHSTQIASNNNKPKSPRMNSHMQGSKGGSSKNDSNEEDESPTIQKKKGGGGGSQNNLLNAAASQQITSSSTPTVMEFPNGKETLKFDDFIGVIRESCEEKQMAENYLVLAFSMFDRQKKGYISTDDLKEVFEILGETISDEEVNTMIKIAGIKSNDKINFMEFKDFFYKID